MNVSDKISEIIKREFPDGAPLVMRLEDKQKLILDIYRLAVFEANFESEVLRCTLES